MVMIGSGGVGKTTMAAALGLRSAAAGDDTLVMTFDPSLRVKDALGVGGEAKGEEVTVPFRGSGRLVASLLDAKMTFDRLIQDYAPDEASAQRILRNPYYDGLAGGLAGILEYMAVERLWEVVSEGRYSRVILDTPPTRQALDFLKAPERIVGFLDSGALSIALKGWFDREGHLKALPTWGGMGRRVEGWLDKQVGMDLLRDMSEFFRAFGPLFEGFRERAETVRQLLRTPGTVFYQVASADHKRIPDVLYFARQLEEEGLRSGSVIVNRIHPRVSGVPDIPGSEVFHWLGERDREGLRQLRSLLPGLDVVSLPMWQKELTSLERLDELGVLLE